MRKLFSVLLSVAIVITVFSACNDESKSKDAVIKAEIEKALKDDPMAAKVTVDVKDAVAILSGECMDDKCREHCTMRVETVVGVKSVVNICKVLHKTEMTDDELNKNLYDLTKNLSTINSIKIAAMDGIVQIAGPVTKNEWRALKADIDKLGPKGYDTTMLDIQ